MCQKTQSRSVRIVLREQLHRVVLRRERAFPIERSPNLISGSVFVDLELNLRASAVWLRPIDWPRVNACRYLRREVSTPVNASTTTLMNTEYHVQCWT